MEVLRKIEELILDYPIRKISKELGISNWRIKTLIKSYKKGMTFGQLKVHTACKKLDSELLNKLESQEYSLDDIIVVFVNNLKEKGYNISEISSLMHIPDTELNKFFDELYFK